MRIATISLAALFTASIFLSACGGSDNDAPSTPLMQINDENFISVSAWTLKLMLREYRSPDGKRALNRRFINYSSSDPISLITEDCDYGGQVTTDYSDLDDLLINSGDQIEYRYNNCQEDDWFEAATGSFYIGVVSASGEGISPNAIYTGEYNLEYTLVYDNLFYEEDTENGTKLVNINQSADTETTTTTIQRFEEDGWDYYSTLNNFTIVSNRNRSTGAFTFEMDGKYAEQDLEGAVNIITSETITFPPHIELSYPDGGSFIIRGANDTAMSVTYSDIGADLEYFDGVDVFITHFATWSELNDTIQKELFPQTKKFFFNK